MLKNILLHFDCYVSFFRNPYEGHPTQTESSGYTTFGNVGFDDYSTIEDISDPNKSLYLTPYDDNKSQNWYKLYCGNHVDYFIF